MRREYTNLELKALILDWLVRHGRWGENYFPLDSLVNKLSHAVEKDGKRIRRNVKDLLDEGYIISHKRGDTISLNPTRSREITEYVKKGMKF